MTVMLRARLFSLLFIGALCIATAFGTDKGVSAPQIDAETCAQKFYDEYLAKYYPKALVIRSNFFTNKDPIQVAGALAAFTDLLATEPWFYVSNQPEGFKLARYWEFIIDQCSLINSYLKRAYINIETNTVYVPDYSLDWKARKKQTRLLDYLKTSHNAIYGAYYALAFDYSIKLFNEGILLKDFTKATRYFADLEFMMEKLQGTAYEAEYQEFMKIVKDLLALLKRKRGAANAALLDRLYGDDEKAKKYAQESLALSKGG